MLALRYWLMWRYVGNSAFRPGFELIHNWILSNNCAR
jgi:hypothetical protein